MPFKSTMLIFTPTTFNKYGLHLRWPRIWIIILGLILVFLCLSIAGMEIGHTIFDFRRSTAFGGFILFIPLLICAIFVLITACKPRLFLLRIAVVLCCIMIILCMLLIAYDILVLIDPTRCFFLNCDYAVVNASNSTTNITVTGWPITITWPSYFQTNMNAKRIFQSIQILCAGLYILFASLYLLTYYIYRHIQLDQHTMYAPDHRATSVKQSSYENNRITPGLQTSFLSPSYPQFNPHYKVQTYTIEGQPNTIKYNTVKSDKAKTFVRSRSISGENDRLCRRCNKEPRMMLVSDYERETFYPYLCINCNNELANVRRKPRIERSDSVRRWRH